MTPLQAVLQRVSALQQRGAQPVVVFDLDSTLIDTAHRHLRILREFCFEKPDPEMVRLAAGLVPTDIGWSLEDALQARGFDDADALRELRTYWFARFFQDDYCRTDLPTRGAPAFVRAVWEAGATVCYLTARPLQTMGHGTVHTLQRWGMPVLTGRTVLHLKADPQQADHAFKQAALDDIAALGHVAATFENEPANCNSFAGRFPEALHVIVGGVHSPQPPPLDPRVLHIRDFA